MKSGLGYCGNCGTEVRVNDDGTCTRCSRHCITQPSEGSPVNNNVLEKLDPKRYPNMSPQMAALLGCILRKNFGVTPAIAELIVTSDGFLMARDEGDIGFNRFLGAASDLRQNWERLLDAAGLGREEREAAENLYRDAVQTTAGMH